MGLEWKVQGRFCFVGREDEGGWDCLGIRFRFVQVFSFYILIWFCLVLVCIGYSIFYFSSVLVFSFDV